MAHTVTPKQYAVLIGYTKHLPSDIAKTYMQDLTAILDVDYRKTTDGHYIDTLLMQRKRTADVIGVMLRRYTSDGRRKAIYLGTAQSTIPILIETARNTDYRASDVADACGIPTSRWVRYTSDGD